MICPPDRSSSSRYPYEYFVVFMVIEQEAVSPRQCSLSIRSDRSRSLTEIALILTERECRQNLSVSGIQLHRVVFISPDIERVADRTVEAQPQPQPQQEYWRWRVEQNLPFDQFDVQHSGTVEDQWLSPTAEYFMLGQVQAALTIHPDRF